MKQLVLGAVMIMLLSGTACQSMTGKSAGRHIDDSTITAQVKSKLAAENASSLGRVDVDTNNATVMLNGTVQSPQSKMQAEQLARQVDGVKKVVNNLQVERN